MVFPSPEKERTFSPNFGLAQPPALEQDERKQQKTMMGERPRILEEPPRGSTSHAARATRAKSKLPIP
jgi:hypothetical protein